MKLRVVKFHPSDVYENITNGYGFRLANYEVQKKNVKEGDIILSLKYGKRRRLITGRIYFEPTYYGRYHNISWNCYFIPRDNVKFLETVNFHRRYEDARR